MRIAYRQYMLQRMRALVEEREAAKTIDKLQPQVAEKYAFWCAIVRQSGPIGLRAIKSLHDEKLSGKLAHMRSSRPEPAVARDLSRLCRRGDRLRRAHHAARLPTTVGERRRSMAAKVKKKMPSEYAPARVRVALTPGDSVRVARELQEMTQAELAQACGIPQPTISSIESGRATLGAERAAKLALALKVHPAVLLWPNWDADAESKRSAG